VSIDIAVVGCWRLKECISNS